MADEEVENPDTNNNTNTNNGGGGGGGKTWDTVFDKSVKEAEDMLKYQVVKIDFKEKNRLSIRSNYDVWHIRMSGF